MNVLMKNLAAYVPCVLLAFAASNVHASAPPSRAQLGARCEAVDSNDDNLSLLNLTVSAIPEVATSTRDIVVTTRLSNPTNDDVRYLIGVTYPNDVGVSVEDSHGRRIRLDHQPRSVGTIGSSCNVNDLGPDESAVGKQNLYDLGYDLAPGTYFVAAVRASFSGLAKSKRSSRVKIVISE